MSETYDSNDWLKKLKEFGEQPSKPVYYLVWRHIGRGKINKFLITASEITPDDIMFVDCSEFLGYAVLVDFVRHSDGTISNWQVANTNIPKETQVKMGNQEIEYLKLIDAQLTDEEKKAITIIPSLKQAKD